MCTQQSPRTAKISHFAFYPKQELSFPPTFRGILHFGYRRRFLPRLTDRTAANSTADYKDVDKPGRKHYAPLDFASYWL
jgi:hypothetical protein